MADLAANSDHDLAIVLGRTSWITGAAAIRQTVIHRLLTALGESPYDRSQGVPYLTIMFVAGIPDYAKVQILQRVAAETPGVTSIDADDWTFEKDANTGALSIVGKVETLDGPVEIELEVPS